MARLMRRPAIDFFTKIHQPAPCFGNNSKALFLCADWENNELAENQREPETAVSIMR
jgi:hypothetical protein